MEIGMSKDAETEIDGQKVEALPDETEIAIELGLKIGFASFYVEHMPVYWTLSLGALGHRFDADGDYFQFNSFLIGTGFVAYPFSFIQVAGSFGYSFTYNDTSDPCCEPYGSEFGLGYDVSVALQLGRSPSGFLIGAKYMWLTNILETSKAKQVSSGIFIFAKYTFRTVDRNNRR
jgi:hypothetical protein